MNITIQRGIHGDIVVSADDGSGYEDVAKIPVSWTDPVKIHIEGHEGDFQTIEISERD